jgi:hypothetical protein
MQKKRLIDSISDTHIEGINDIFRKWKRESKSFRKYLDKKINPIEGNSFRKFRELVMVDPDPDGTWMRNWFSSWNTHSFNNDFRFFIFKLRYNYIGTNNRLNAYLKDVDPRCTYCRMLDVDSNQRDSLLHCFLQCETAQRFLRSLTEVLNLEYNVNEEFWKIFLVRMQGEYKCCRKFLLYNNF